MRRRPDRPGRRVPARIAGGRVPRRWQPEWSQTIRFRLTLAYSSLLFGLAALVVIGVYLAVSSTAEAEPLRAVRVQEGYRLSSGKIVTTGEAFQAANLRTVQQAVNLQTLETLRTYSLAALGALFVASLLIGWWLSGRVLRPVRRITESTQEITATDLSRRIALNGPRDELGALADTVDDMLERLDRAFTAQRRLIDDASHELRNPLAVIQANLDAVLSRDDVTAAERRQATAVVGRATRRMTRLVEDLLASARRAAPALAEADVDLAGIAREAAEEYRVIARDRGLRLGFHLTPTVVIGDSEALRRAVDNLLSNAVRVAPTGSEIVLSAAGTDDGWGHVAVADAGPGIPAEDRERVFDRFWRAPTEPAAGRQERRNGLGLAIVRQIVESHGGAVGVHSEVGSGSTFVLWLPRADADRRSASPPTGDPAPAPSPAPALHG